jgi:hypothetical protein
MFSSSAGQILLLVVGGQDDGDFVDLGRCLHGYMRVDVELGGLGGKAGGHGARQAEDSACSLMVPACQCCCRLRMVCSTRAIFFWSRQFHAGEEAHLRHVLYIEEIRGMQQQRRCDTTHAAEGDGGVPVEPCEPFGLLRQEHQVRRVHRQPQQRHRGHRHSMRPFSHAKGCSVPKASLNLP